MHALVYLDLLKRRCSRAVTSACDHLLSLCTHNGEGDEDCDEARSEGYEGCVVVAIRG